jgi:cardiolipin synthase
MVVLDQETVRTLQRHFSEDLDRSRAIDLTRWENRSVRQRVLETAVAPIRRWL